MNKIQRKAEVIQQISLQADSAYNAWYRLRLVQIRDGYVVEKYSGSSRGRGQMEAWFRWDLVEAERVFAKIVQQKTKPSRTRVYRMSSVAVQLDLFSTEH